VNKGASDPQVQGFVSYQCREIGLGRWKLKLTDPQEALVDNDGEATAVRVEKHSSGDRWTFPRAARTVAAGRAGEAAALRSAPGGDDGGRRCREAVDCCVRRRRDGRAARRQPPQEGPVRRRLYDPRRCRNRPCGSLGSG